MDLIGKMVLWTKLWYYGQTYVTIPKTMENYGTSIYERRKHGRLPKTKKRWFIMKKPMVLYQNNWSFLTNL